MRLSSWNSPDRSLFQPRASALDEGRFSDALPAFQDRHEVELVARLEYPRDGPEEHQAGHLAVIGVVGAAEVVHEQVVHPRDAVPRHAGQHLADGVIGVLHARHSEWP